MRCETTSSVKECALRARSTHGVHHAIVEVNVVIGVVLGEVLVARVVPLVVDAVVGLTLSLIAHVGIVVFVVAIFNRIFLYGRYTLYTSSTRRSLFLLFAFSVSDETAPFFQGILPFMQLLCRGLGTSIGICCLVHNGRDSPREGGAGNQNCHGQCIFCYPTRSCRTLSELRSSCCGCLCFTSCWTQAGPPSPPQIDQHRS